MSKRAAAVDRSSRDRSGRGGYLRDAMERTKADHKRWCDAGCPVPGIKPPSDRVLASKGKPARYVRTFFDHCDPKVRERISVAMAKIDRNPHKDPIWKPIDYRALPTPAQMGAAAARVSSFRVETVDAGEECGERADRLPHEAMADGRCSHCDRWILATEASDTSDAAAFAVGSEPEPAPIVDAVIVATPRRKRAPRVKPPAWNVFAARANADAMAERIERTGTTEPDHHEPAPVYTGPVIVPDPIEWIAISTPFSGSSQGAGLPREMCPHTVTKEIELLAARTVIFTECVACGKTLGTRCLTPDPVAVRPRFAGAGAWSLRGRSAA